MIRKISLSGLVGLLSAQLICAGCSSVPTIKKPMFKNFSMAKPISSEDLERIQKDSPKDAVFADLLQAFAMMRTADLKNATIRKEIVGYLSSAVNSFEDMNDPVNFSMAFSADESKPFRGRPHERMFASAMAGVFMMADNRCDMALPYLKNAEFLDARFQKLPFGTDAPLIYALSLRCLAQQNADAEAQRHVSDGIFRSVRFLSMQESLIEALTAVSEADMRAHALSNRIAYMIAEISIYHSLISAPNNAGVDQLIDDALKNASLFIATLQSNFADEYKVRMQPQIKELAEVYGMNHKKGLALLDELAFEHVSFELGNIGQHLKALCKSPSFNHHKKVQAAFDETAVLSKKIIDAALAKKMVISFSGMGPSLERQGSYEEISVIKTSPDGSDRPEIRQKKLLSPRACGFHRTDSGGFAVVLCKPGLNLSTDNEEAKLMPNLELLSLSRKAKMIGGRKFDKVLHGRAQFRAATEKMAEITAWSAFFLFHMGTSILNDCSRSKGNEACYATGFALLGIAGLTIVFSGTVWLIGRSSNPAADSRYIHLMYESAWVAI